MDIRFALIIGRVLALFLMAIGISFVYVHSIKGLSNTDKIFIEAAYKDGLAVVAMAEVAMARTENPAVKDFAIHMLKDHSSANKELMQLAMREGVSLPKDMGENGREKVERFSIMGGQDFDRAYIEQEVDDRREDLKEYSREVNEGSNPGLKKIASRMLQKLEQHLSMASAIDQKAG